MIGTKVRGFRHFIRVAKTLQEVVFFFKHDNFGVGGGVALYMDGSKYKNPFMSSSGDYLILFNDCYHNVKSDVLYCFDAFNDNKELKDKMVTLRNTYGSVWVVPVGRSHFKEDSSYFSELVVMPENFDKMYDDFCTANKKQMPNATRFSSINCSLFKYFFAISSGSKNFFFWAVNAYFKNRTSIYQIENILRWNDKYNQLQSKLSKGTITAYTSGSDFFTIVREMMQLRRNKRANDVISSFNTQQKKALKEYKLSDRDYDTLSKFGKLSSKKKNNFIRKMSTIEDPAEILRQMSFLADIHFEWNKKSFMDYLENLEGLNCKVIIDRDNIVLLRVDDYEAVKRLAKATNWCISKDKKYWNEYVEMNHDATQYVLFDFSRKEDDNLSIVGFTSVHDRGITHAHDFQNRNIMGSKRTNTVAEIKSFVSKYVDCSNIYGVLDRNGINLSDVVSYEPTHYKWNRNSMFDYLEQCISDDDYYIIYDDGNRVVLIAENDDVKYFLGDAYMDNRHYNHQQGDQHIIFADFNKKAGDPEKLVFGVIHHNFATHESSCDRLFNDRFEQIAQSFDSKLEEYGLPYDIICRSENAVDRFYTAFMGFELSVAKELIKDKAVIEDIKTLNRSAMLRDALINVTFGYYSADYVNLIYDSGLTIYDVLGDNYASDFGRRLLNTLCDEIPNAHVPSEEDIDKFKKGEIGRYNYAVYVGIFMILMSFIDHEKNIRSFASLIPSVVERHRRTDLFDLIMSRICEVVDVNDMNYGKFIAHYAFSNHSSSVINALNKANLSPRMQEYIKGFGDTKAKTTEIWVRRENGAYALQTVTEESVAHAPRRR